MLHEPQTARIRGAQEFFGHRENDGVFEMAVRGAKKSIRPDGIGFPSITRLARGPYQASGSECWAAPRACGLIDQDGLAGYQLDKRTGLGEQV